MSARVTIDVVASIMPGHPEVEFTRRYVITDEQWNAATGPEQRSELLAGIASQAQEYGLHLMCLAARVNWVRVEWLYL